MRADLKHEDWRGPQPKVSPVPTLIAIALIVAVAAVALYFNRDVFQPVSPAQVNAKQAARAALAQRLARGS